MRHRRGCLQKRQSFLTAFRIRQRCDFHHVIVRGGNQASIEESAPSRQPSAPEVISQDERYVDADVKFRDLDQPNRLHTVALAVVTLTDYERVTEADEDRDYFKKFWECAQLERNEQLLQEWWRCSTECRRTRRRKFARRERSLNATVVAMAFLTVISMTADACSSVRDEEVLLAPRSVPVHFLVCSVVLPTVPATLVVVRSAGVGLTRCRSCLRFRRGWSRGRPRPVGAPATVDSVPPVTSRL